MSTGRPPRGQAAAVADPSVADSSASPLATPAPMHTAPVVGAEGDVVVRMYNVGFGDAFLVTIPAPDRPRRVLIDCGMHLSGQGPRSIGEVAENIVRDVTDADGQARIDVVVASHRHFDHIAGFGSPVWAGVVVGEVWLPWIEDPRDPAATRIREAQAKAALALAAVASPRSRAGLAVAELVGNALSNDEASATLRRGFAGNPRRRFLPVANAGATFKSRVLPGVKVHVLGPSRDHDVIRDMDPPATQSYLRLRAGADATTAGGLRPFTSGTPVDERGAERAIKDLHKALRADLFGLAVALEAAVNGTSLVLAFEVGDAVLLFTGDAQWGTWRAAMEQFPGILARTTFLKIGHHGSHNATPRDLVEHHLPDGFVAMVSVGPVTRWPQIPKSELLERLELKASKIVRSDRLHEHVSGLHYGPDDAYVDVAIAT